MKSSRLHASEWARCWSFVIILPVLVLLAPRASSGRPPADEGESTYKAKCAMCHGADGSGDTPMGKKLKLKDLRSADVQKQSDAQLADVIAKGKSPMQAYEKTLDKDKIQQVVAYIRGLAKKK